MRVPVPAWCSRFVLDSAEQEAVTNLVAVCYQRLYRGSTSTEPLRWALWPVVQVLGELLAPVHRGVAHLRHSGLVWSYVLQAAISAYGFRWALRIAALVTAVILAIALALMRIVPGSLKLSKTGSTRDSLYIFKTEKWLIP